MTEVIAEELPGHPVGVLTGPNLAQEILSGHAAATVVAFSDDHIAHELQQIFAGELFRVYTNPDVVGCEVAGALKNVDRHRLGHGRRPRHRRQHPRRGHHPGPGRAVPPRAWPWAASSSRSPGWPAWATWSPPASRAQSRNRYVGEQLGKGRTIDEIVAEMKMVAEGVKTSQVVGRAGRAVRRRDADRRGDLRRRPRGAHGGRRLPGPAAPRQRVRDARDGLVRHRGRVLRTWMLRRADGAPAHHRRHDPPPLDLPAAGRGRRGRGAQRAGAGRRPHRVPGPAHAGGRPGRARLGVALLARAPDRPGVAVVRAPRPPAVPHQPHPPQLDRGRQPRLGHARRSSTRAGWSRRGRTAGRSTGGSAPTTAGTCRRARWRCASASSAPRPWSRRPCASRPATRCSASTPSGAAAPRAAASWSSSRSRTRRRVPVALALAVRPYNPEGLAVVERIDLRGSAVAVDGRVALLLPRAAAPGRGLDVPRRRLGRRPCSAATPPSAGGRRCATRPGLAQAAFVYPLAHGATLPGRHPARSRARGPPPRRRPPPAGGGARVPRGAAAGRGGGRRVAGAERPGHAARAARRPPGRGGRRQPPVPAAAPRRRRDHPGPGDLPPVLVPRRRLPARRPRPLRLPRRGRPGARLVPGPAARRRVLLQPGHEWDANGAALVALAQHWRLARDTPFVEGIVEPIARGAHWIERKRRSSGGRKGGGDAALAGLLPGGDVGRAPRPVRPLLLGRLLGRGGPAGRAPTLLRAAGQPDAAADARRFAGRHVVRRRGVAGGDRRAAWAPPPSRPARGGASTPGAIGVAGRLRPARAAGGRRPPHRATADALRERFTLEPTAAPSSRGSATAGSAPT